MDEYNGESVILFDDYDNYTADEKEFVIIWLNVQLFSEKLGLGCKKMPILIVVSAEPPGAREHTMKSYGKGTPKFSEMFETIYISSIGCPKWLAHEEDPWE